MRILLWTILLVGAPFMAADTEPEPPANNAARPKVTGPLSPQEERFQGDWKAYDFLKSNRLEYAMTGSLGAGDRTRTCTSRQTPTVEPCRVPFRTQLGRQGPCMRLWDAASGEWAHAFSIAFSPDGTPSGLVVRCK